MGQKDEQGKRTKPGRGKMTKSGGAKGRSGMGQMEELASRLSFPSCFLVVMAERPYTRSWAAPFVVFTVSFVYR